MTRTLVLVRHAKSDWSHDVPEHDRPLAARGRRDAPAVGRWLREHVPSIDMVLCSSAVRALTTWRLAAAELDVTPAFRVEPRIYAAPTDELLALVHDLPDEASTVVFVGHNPGLTELVWYLARSENGLRTASIAVLRGGGDWLDAAAHWAELVAFETPRG